MFKGWATSDDIALGAFAVSVIAVVLSGLSLRYTAVQAGVARRRERAELAAQEPMITGEFVFNLIDEWWHFQLMIRNRIDVPIVLEELRVLSPRALVELQNTEEEYASQPPSNPKRAITLDMDLDGAGVTGDRSQLDLLVSLPTRSSKDRESLMMSVSVRRANESMSYAEIIVVTKAPPVSTSTAT